MIKVTVLFIAWNFNTKFVFLLYRISDRVLDVARKMEVAVDIGSGRGFVTRYLNVCVLHC